MLKSKRMFDRHPYTNEVMTLYNLDVARSECMNRLVDNEVLSVGKRNLTAIDIYGMYEKLIKFVYLRKGEEAPVGDSISTLMEKVLEGVSDEVKADLLEHIDEIVEWRATPLPLNNLRVTMEDLHKHMAKLNLFYEWVDLNHFYN